MQHTKQDNEQTSGQNQQGDNRKNPNTSGKTYGSDATGQQQEKTGEKKNMKHQHNASAENDQQMQEVNSNQDKREKASNTKR